MIAAAYDEDNTCPSMPRDSYALMLSPVLPLAGNQLPAAGLLRKTLRAERHSRWLSNIVFDLQEIAAVLR